MFILKNKIYHIIRAKRIPWTSIPKHKSFSNTNLPKLIPPNCKVRHQPMIGWAECDSLMHTVVCMETIYQHALINLQHKRGSWRIAVNYLQPKGELVLSYVFICAHNRHIHILKAIVNSTTRNMHAVGNKTQHKTKLCNAISYLFYCQLNYWILFNYGSLASFLLMLLLLPMHASTWWWPSRNTDFFALYIISYVRIWTLESSYIH